MKPHITESDFQWSADFLKCEVAAIKAVAQVESGGRGGFNPDGSPLTLFEGHKFHKFTNGKFDLQAPDLSFKKWTKKFYGRNWEAEQKRLTRAILLDRNAALMSVSWGMFQVMGFNYPLVGFSTIQDFVNAAYKSEGEHLKMFVRYVVSAGLASDIRTKDWRGFALGYNGIGYEDNNYHGKMASAYETFT
jgi:hypothetical protein